MISNAQVSPDIMFSACPCVPIGEFGSLVRQYIFAPRSSSSSAFENNATGGTWVSAQSRPIFGHLLLLDNEIQPKRDANRATVTLNGPRNLHRDLSRIEQTLRLLAH